MYCTILFSLIVVFKIFYFFCLIELFLIQEQLSKGTFIVRLIIGKQFETVQTVSDTKVQLR
jgi:hypothetical protein